ncbi:GGDEF domain-containing protein [Mesorhizobium sp. YIM 152430]|uniref:GGDEF domain-containing protein n=1 Tax=Mesorhizobium sp. YIM 152430 TaxID=3031761 RepID=UPI0023DC4B23|nr:GGDEF domain-containing protein [Mesorhizobium sp. YIM 152430]MDF1599226.1 GGDEF domain-containing protein [Mesorhizobium sp. YIM 152430]
MTRSAIAIAGQTRISRRGALMLARWTILGTLGCLAISLAWNWLAFRHMDALALRQGLISATVLPIILAGPLFFYLTLKLRELASANHQLAELASTDHLTKCLNRRALVGNVEQLLDENEADAQGALLVIDADHFKQVNDLYGHHQGDLALIRIASVIRSCVRQGDLVGRMGGEEFAVLLGGVAPEQAVRIAERIRHAVAAAPLDIDGAQHRLTISVGCTAFSGRAKFRDLFSLADQRLYEAKRLGRNRVEAGADADMKKAG